jgi:hypothetical protein
MYNHQHFTFLLRDGANHKQYLITTRDDDSNWCTSCRENLRYTMYLHSQWVIYNNLLQRYHRADLECYPFQVTHPPHNHPLRLYVVMCTHSRVHRRSKAPSNLYDNRVMHALAYNVSYTHLVSTSSSCEPITFLTKIFSKGSAIVCEYCFIPLRLLPNLLRLLCSVLSHNIFE